jgi:hypothetical protein
MPLREEQVAQVEVALRQRFFGSIPKVMTTERADWTEEQHDVDRLSRALAAYTLVGLCGVDDTTAAGAVTDGKDDGGIDALYFHQSGNQLVFSQAKFKRGGAAPSQAENLKTINGIKDLQNRRFDKFNEAFRNRLDEIEEALDTAGVQIVLVLGFLGENLGEHVIKDLDALKTEMNRLSPRMDWQAAGLTKIHSWLLGEQTPIVIDTQIVLENWASVTAPRKAIWHLSSSGELSSLGGKGRVELPTDGKILINVGSVGQPRDLRPDACYAVYDASCNSVEFRRIAYDVLKTKRKILRAKLPAFAAQRLSLGR